jgi:hypothetical protein
VHVMYPWMKSGSINLTWRFCTVRIKAGASGVKSLVDSFYEAFRLYVFLILILIN